MASDVALWPLPQLGVQETRVICRNGGTSASMANCTRGALNYSPIFFSFSYLFISSILI
jgi:hypothetical protein